MGLKVEVPSAFTITRYELQAEWRWRSGKKLSFHDANLMRNVVIPARQRRYASNNFDLVPNPRYSAEDAGLPSAIDGADVLLAAADQLIQDEVSLDSVSPPDPPESLGARHNPVIIDDDDPPDEDGGADEQYEVVAVRRAVQRAPNAIPEAPYKGQHSDTDASTTPWLPERPWTVLYLPPEQRIADELLLFSRWLKPSISEKKVREDALKCIAKALDRAFAEYHLVSFGSRQVETADPSRSYCRLGPQSLKRFCNLSVDITLNEPAGSESTHLVASLIEANLLIRPLTLFFKLALARWRLNIGSEGGVSGFVLTMLVTFVVLQNRKDGERLQDLIFLVIDTLCKWDTVKFGIQIFPIATMFGLNGGRSPRQIVVKNPASLPEIFVMNRKAPRPPFNCAASVKKWDEVVLRFGELRDQLLLSAFRQESKMPPSSPSFGV
ncbi:hypothetical protein A4X13_0g6888 [Tilletia indica]|uniref:Polynucleotide adenylyltransferase n=1 Tax=Tilletia indica TaxID=43049 RepID=A0A8T8SM86_9BASI|nr:hypothetical protein A4X13_0g6888 [Tilletia indica]